MTSTSPSPASRPRLTSHSRLVLALQETSIIWASNLRYPAPAVSLLARLPCSAPVMARIAPYDPTSSAAVVTYRTQLELAPSFLIIRSPPSSSSKEPIVGLLSLSTACISQIRPGVLAVAGILLEPHPRDFGAVATALSRAVARPAPPPLSRFEVMNILAVGSRARVFSVRDRNSGERLALKLVRRPDDPADVTAWRTRLVHDRAILQRVRGHPFILDLRHAKLLPDAAALFFEHCSHDLFNFIRLRGAPLSEEEAVAIIAQLLLAVARIHTAGGAVTAGPGRGLRPENIFLDDHGWVRLACFGYCSALDQTLLDDAHLFRKQSIASKKSRRRSKTRESTHGLDVKQSSLVYRTEDCGGHITNDASRRAVAKKLATDLDEGMKIPISKPQEKNDDCAGKGQKGKQTDHGSGAAACGLPHAGPNTIAPHVSSPLSADLWSLGALAHFVLTGEFPLQESSIFDESSTSSSDDFEHKNRTIKDLGISPAIQSDAARDFVGGLLRPDPALRLGCGPEGLVALQKHEWFAGITWQELERRQGPYSLRVDKHKDVSLLGLDEQDVREAMSSSVLPEGLIQRDARRPRLSKLFTRESREGRVSDEKRESQAQQSVSKGNDKLDVKDRMADNYSDNGFVFGFEFSSSGPAFSAEVWPRRNPGVETETAKLESGRKGRGRWHGASKGNQSSSGTLR